jgi:hypothetical protein
LTAQDTTKNQQEAAAPEIELRHLCPFRFGKGNLAFAKEFQEGIFSIMGDVFPRVRIQRNGVGFGV